MVILVIYIIGFLLMFIGFRIWDPYIPGETGLNEYWEPYEIEEEDHNWSHLSFALMWPITLIGLFIRLILK